MYHINHDPQIHTPWNKGKLVGQKPPLKLKEIWAIRIRLQISTRIRELALFNLAIDSKLRSCDLVKIRVRDISHGNTIASRAMIMQQKTHQAVRFEITEQTRDSISNWIKYADLDMSDYLFKSRLSSSPHISTRQYARIVGSWVLKSMMLWRWPNRLRCSKSISENVDSGVFWFPHSSHSL